MAESAPAEPPLRERNEPLPHRAPGETITREDIVQAATRIVMAGGSGEVSVHALAADLGVSPVSLYRYISSSDGVLDEAVDRLLDGAWRPGVSEGDWQAWVTEAAVRLHDFLVSQPAALHLYLMRPVTSAAAVARMGAVMRVLRRAGLDEGTARSAYGALHTYTIGFAALEASRAGWTPDSADGSTLARQLAGYTSAGQFTDGLRYLLEGIACQCRYQRSRKQLPRYGSTGSRSS